MHQPSPQPDAATTVDVLSFDAPDAQLLSWTIAGGAGSLRPRTELDHGRQRTQNASYRTGVGARPVASPTQAASLGDEAGNSDYDLGDDGVVVTDALGRIVQ